MKQKLHIIYIRQKWQLVFRMRRVRLYWRYYEREFGWLWRVVNGAGVFLLFAGFVAIPVLSNIWQTNRYQLDATAVKLVGKTDSSLADKLTYDPTKQEYVFNRDGLQQQANPSDPAAALLRSRTGAAGKGSSNLYALELPQDFSKGVAYHDTNTELSFSLVPQFSGAQGQEVQGHLVYPLDQGDRAIYTLKGNGLKEDIVVPRAFTNQMTFTYAFNLPDTLAARMIPGTGEVGIYSADPSLYGNISYGTTADQERVMQARVNGSKNHLVFGLPAPIIKDANGVATKAIAKFELSGETLKVVASNLSSIKGSFTVDPSVVVTSSSDFMSGNNEGNIDFSTAGQINRGGLTGGTVSGGWTTNSTSFTTTRYGHAAVAYNSYLYIMGGYSGTYLNDVQYAPINANGTIGTWSATTSFTTAHYNFGAVAFNGYMYILGGYSGVAGNTYLNDVQYAPINANGTIGTWHYTHNSTDDGTTFVAGFTTARYGHAAVAYNGYLYVMGGYNGTTYYNDVQYAPINANGTIGTWHYTHNSTDDGTTFVAGFTTARYRFASVAYNGYLYVMGGSGGSDLNDVQYAPINANGTIGAWATTTSFTAARDGFAGVAYNGYLYVMGGYNGTTYYNDVQYAPINANGTIGAWATTTSFTTARGYFATVVYNGYLYIMGGYNGGTYYNDVQYAKIDPAGVTGNYSSASSLPSSVNFATSVVYNGYIYVIGGSVAGVLTTAVNYATINSDGTLGTWTATTSLPTATNVAASVVYNGNIYEIGGSTNNTTICSQPTSVVRYALVNSNGTLGAWNATTSLPLSICELTAVAYNGYIYTVGGHTSSSYISNVYYAVINSDGTVGAWTSTSSLPAATSYATSVVDNGYVYAIGGEISTGATASVYYAAINSDGTLGAWTGTTSLPVATRYAASVVYNGYVYELGGGGASVYYVPINSNGTLGTWVSTVGLPSGEANGSAVVYNGYIYQTGGASTSVYYAKINNGGAGTMGTWAATTSLPAATDYATSAVYNGYLYEIGGGTTVDYAPINANGTIGAWTATTSLPTATEWATSVTYNGYLYEIGGYTTANVATVDYAPINANGTIGAWTATTSLPTATRLATSAVYNGYLYEIGGYTTAAVATVDYAPINANGTIGAWTATTSLPTATYDYATSVAYNGYLYEMGGYNSSNTPLSTVDYAPINANGTIGAWTATTSLPAAISEATSVTYNGYLYEIGGYTTANVATVDYAPINANGTIGAWTATTSLPTATRLATSAVYNGYLYEIGGYTTAAVATVDYAPINSVAPVGHYSKLIDLGTLASLSSISYNGSLPGGLAAISYKTAGTDGVLSANNSASSLNNPACSGGSLTTRYVFVTITLDDTQGATFPDSSGSRANVTDFTVNYSTSSHPAPTVRLRLGQTLQNGVLGALDTCGP